MQLEFHPFDLRLSHEWTIANGVADSPLLAHVVFVQLQNQDGVIGLGESAPSGRYGEDTATVQRFLKRIDPQRLSFNDLPGSMAYLETLAPGNFAAKAAINIALLDGAARLAGQPIYDFLGLGFTESKHLTSFTVGLAKPDMIRTKVLEAATYPILKLKLGAPADRENLAALRKAAPLKTVRVDANEAWKTREDALRNLEWLASDPHIQFVEQPMSAGTQAKDLIWLKERSPLPLFADESFHHASDAELCAACFHGVNVKLVKTGGISGAFDALQAARKAGLKTMIGCMIESSILIAAAAHLAELADYLDIDGNLLICNDPFAGPTAVNGVVSFREATEKSGLRVGRRKAV